MNADTYLQSQCWVRKGDTKWFSFLHFYYLLLMPKNYQYYCQQTIRQQKTHQNFITSLNGECRYKFAGSLLSQKRGYKMNFISTHLVLVADIHAMVSFIEKRHHWLSPLCSIVLLTILKLSSIMILFHFSNLEIFFEKIAIV